MKKYPITPLIIHTNKEDSLKITTTYDEDFDLWRINIEKDAILTKDNICNCGHERGEHGESCSECSCEKFISSTIRETSLEEKSK